MNNNNIQTEEIHRNLNNVNNNNEVINNENNNHNIINVRRTERKKGKMMMQRICS